MLITENSTKGTPPDDTATDIFDLAQHRIDRIDENDDDTIDTHPSDITPTKDDDLNSLTSLRTVTISIDSTTSYNTNDSIIADADSEETSQSNTPSMPNEIETIAISNLPWGDIMEEGDAARNRNFLRIYVNNINGIGGNTERDADLLAKSFEHLKSAHVDIALLSETHLNDACNKTNQLLHRATQQI